MPGMATRLLAILSVWLLSLGAAALAQTSYELTDAGFVPVAIPEPGSPAAELAAARKRIAQDEPKRAVELLKQWFKDHPDDPLTVEAHLLHGDAQIALGNHYKSLWDFEEVITFYPASEQFWTALEREYEIGVLFTTGFKRKLWGVRWLPAWGEGAELLIRVQERAPGSAIGEKASVALADYYYASSQMELASEAYDLFLINYPESELRQWALLRLIQASLARFKGPEFDATGLIDAGERLRQYRDEYPAGADTVGVEALLVRIRESLARRDFSSASWYDRTGRDVSAVLLYRALIQDYPDTTAARDAVARLNAMGEAPVASDDE